MSITFSIRRYDPTTNTWADVPGESLNVSNRNAALLLDLLGIDPQPFGQAFAPEMASKCQKMLATLSGPQRQEFGVSTEITEGANGCMAIHYGVDADYLEHRIGELARMAKAAGVDVISWA